MRKAARWGAAAALLLATACHRHADEDAAAPDLNDTSEQSAPSPAAAPAPVAPEAPAPHVSNTVADLPPPDEPPAPDQQMQDDAAATGMTARLPEDQASEPAGNSAVSGSADGNSD